jgi:predicted neutral ceramidase superfamily lipid hydrolase
MNLSPENNLMETKKIVKMGTKYIMENERSNRTFDDIYRETSQEITNHDRKELLIDFINKLKQIIHQGQFIIDNLDI